MTDGHPLVDVNVFAYNAEATIAAAIECVLAQTWPAVQVTVIDNGSTDDTVRIARGYCSAVPNVRLHRARVNAGALVNCQRAFAFGDADFVMPKTADDILDPSFIEKAMTVLLAHPKCAMCHAQGLVFRANGELEGVYPDSHALNAVGDDPIFRALLVMQRYTSAPSFWGVYRRATSDRLSRFRYRAGWDHVALAELAVHGEIRHVPEVLYLRRNGGKPVSEIARGCTESNQRGLSFDDLLADLHWITPLITTAFGHLEAFAVAPLSMPQRISLMDAVPRIFGDRWGRLLRSEAETFAAALPSFIARAASAPQPAREWMRRQLADATAAVCLIMPNEPSAITVKNLVLSSREIAA
jgi:hypothetical protein